MKPINVIESDKDTARACLKIAFGSSFAFGIIIFFLYKEKNLHEVVFLMPVLAFLFNFGLHLFFKKRDATNVLVLNEKQFLFEINGVKKSFSLESIKKIEVEKFWGAQRSNFVFYVCTDNCRERIPRFESVTDIKIAKTLIFMNPDIDATDARKVFGL